VNVRLSPRSLSPRPVLEPGGGYIVDTVKYQAKIFFPYGNPLVIRTVFKSGRLSVIRRLAAPKGSCRIHQPTAILRERYRRLRERFAPQESGCGLCLQRTGAGDCSQR